MESKREIVASAILETPLGVIVVQDKFDQFSPEIVEKIKIAVANEPDEEKKKRVNYLLQIMQDGRFRLPGGDITAEEFQKAGLETGSMNEPIDRANSKFVEVIRESVADNVKKQLGLSLDRADIVNIPGLDSNHVICLSKARGKVELNRDKLAGVGFLDHPSVLPVSLNFLNSATKNIYSNYIQQSYRQSLVDQYQSNLSVGVELIDEWYLTMYRTYLSLAPSRKKLTPRPMHPVSSPNFKIVNR